MATIDCFWAEPTGMQTRFLRRYRDSREGEACPAMPGEHSYHTAMVQIEDGPIVKTADGYIAEQKADRTDARFPTHCACGESFRDDDYWQVFSDSIYRNAATGEGFPLRDAPAGAMYDAWWYRDFAKGPDGRNLVLTLPGGHPWLIDGPANNGGGWTREGTVPHLTANPSVGVHNEDGSWRYHGWLRNGQLVDA